MGSQGRRCKEVAEGRDQLEEAVNEQPTERLGTWDSSSGCPGCRAEVSRAPTSLQPWPWRWHSLAQCSSAKLESRVEGVDPTGDPAREAKSLLVTSSAEAASRFQL